MQTLAKNIMYVTNLVQSIKRDSSVFFSPDSRIDKTDRSVYLNHPFSTCSTVNTSVVLLMLSRFVFMD